MTELKKKKKSFFLDWVELIRSDCLVIYNLKPRQPCKLLLQAFIGENGIKKS